MFKNMSKVGRLKLQLGPIEDFSNVYFYLKNALTPNPKNVYVEQRE